MSIKERVIGMLAKFTGMFASQKELKDSSMNEDLIRMISRIRFIKDNVLDLIRIEDLATTTKYDILDYQKEIEDFRIAALDSLGLGNYDGRTQYLLINEVLKNSSEVMDLMSNLVLIGETDKEVKRKCLVFSGQKL